LAVSRCLAATCDSTFEARKTSGTVLAFSRVREHRKSKDCKNPSVAKDRTMKTAFSSASFLLGVLALTSVASAQVYGIPGAGYPYYGNYHHASTVEQGVLDGIASVTASRGQADYFHSLAAINWQDARSRYITNNKN